MKINWNDIRSYFFFAILTIGMLMDASACEKPALLSQGVNYDKAPCSYVCKPILK